MRVIRRLLIENMMCEIIDCLFCTALLYRLIELVSIVHSIEIQMRKALQQQERQHKPTKRWSSGVIHKKDTPHQTNSDCF